MNVSNLRKLLKHEQSFEDNKKIIYDFSELCKKNDICLVFFLAPMSKEYRQMMSANYLRRTIPSIDLYKVVANRFFDCNTFEWNDEDFVDPDHLSDIGAAKLTSFLYDNLL